ncbi:TPA: isocitrate lyase/phosphoenolpyruvate mutase family protein [Kluyvera ascorbata]|uniref:isocitrate lyase/PEP mutase family protein n=1 Tax=Kluyvera ascorbata TaxID=51288 RepID=UPI0018A531CC|nr:isocitrate lyase/phosphoenolpyruvate mutase family protein [Kluyvera ascorbata]BBV65804.1 carboxyvinyl-carboxyphosphonate phosphorylmutase [Klebsiella sp. STW0522-44]MDU3910604.1 isocitrate lyase/phosphoenolpyruvate mutase family protein [Kluyvera ascorbata]UPQ73728.1 isocitrate lyase/phosphoenolpyruvate mutase family protein [Kluyvera ascorbata]HAT7513961.1 isocitrate lyase/phosphoenolpyruvate mutase family protein [Kluyvera ascorbata]HCL5619487.1 isocitrate lyase/phosphoenolpyruvate mutas
MNFTQLHHQSAPLLIANVWDVPSALAAQRAGYQALGTSSAAIADMLGYPDGEGMSFAELRYIVGRIRAATTLPLSVDIESGYAESVGDIVDNVLQLSALGVAGINLEDSHVRDGRRELLDAEHFAKRLQAIREGLATHRVSLFLNARTDPFLLGMPEALSVTLSRASLYASHGADGLFVPCVHHPEDIAALVRQTALPLNVMAVPGLADFATLSELGVRRISMGNAVHSALQTQLNRLLLSLRHQRSFAGVFDDESHR